MNCRRLTWRPALPPRPAEDLGRATRRDGSVLLLVLVVVAILALSTGTYLDLMQTEHRAVRRHGRAAQSLRLAESGVEYLKTFVSQTPARIQTLGGLAVNATAMKALLANDQPDPFARGRFTIVCPAQVNGIYSGVRYGLEDESAKLNLNVLLAEGADGFARDRLMVMPGMTPEIVDAILDWLDPDEAPRQFGAEQDYYLGLDPPYAPRNGPIAGLDELLLVRGVTPELLYGLDQNRNGFVEAGEVARGALLEIDNADGSMNRGWSAYLTITSVELLGGSPAAPLADLNGGDLQALYNALKGTLTDEQAKFVILYRQYGAPQGGGEPSENGGQPGGEGGGDSRGPTRARQRPTRPEDTGAGGGATVSAASIELNFQQPGNTRINSPLDLIGAQVQVPATPPGGENNGGSGGGNNGNNNGGNNQGGDNGGGQGQGGQVQGGQGQGGQGGPGGQGGQGGNQPPPQNVASPWTEGPASYRELLKLYDAATVVNSGRVAGRVNINAAAKPVLLSIPTMTPAIADQIIAQRELEPSPTLSPQRHALWLLIDGLTPLEQMKQIERYVTTRGDAFSGQSVGFFDGDASPVRGEFVIDRSTTPARLRHWRDLSSWGPGYSPDLLGAVNEAAP